MSTAVHLLRALQPHTMALFRQQLQSEIDLTVGPQEPVPPGCQILVSGRPSREDLSASEQLRALVIPWAGLPAKTGELVREFPHIAVHNLHHNAAPTAEMAVGLMLAAAKRIVPMDRRLRAGSWPAPDRDGQSLVLEGRTALILGHGAVGRRVARACVGLGMEVVAVRRRVSADVAEEYPVHAVSELDVLLPRAQVLVVCLPQTTDTTGLIGADRLALLPRDAVVVNVGRGVVIDEAALYQALCHGSLGAAGLDVWWRYPKGRADGADESPPSNEPFNELDNVVMSPHRAGWSAVIEERRATDLADLLNHVARGEPLPNVVDLDAGY